MPAHFTKPKNYIKPKKTLREELKELARHNHQRKKTLAQLMNKLDSINNKIHKPKH